MANIKVKFISRGLGSGEKRINKFLQTIAPENFIDIKFLSQMEGGDAVIIYEEY